MQVWCDWQLTLCDPHLSALEVRFHDYALYKSMFTFTFTLIPPNLWHPNIPYLNPVDYKICVIMQSRVYQTKICSVDGRRVIDVWCGFEQPTINMAIDH